MSEPIPRAIARGPRLDPPQETERLLLRELRHRDAAFVLELVNDPAWLRFVGDRNVHSLADARAYVDRIREGGYATHGYGLWAVISRATGEPLGVCGLIRRETLPESDLGFALLARARGQGYAREAAAACVRLARERYALTRLVAISTLDNPASHAVLESVGFVRSGEVCLPGDPKRLAHHVLDLPPAL